jgi:hypothetical protein
MENQKAVFTIQGSSDEPYTVVVSFNPFAISCTCQAGFSGLPCKHRKNILNGICENMISAPGNHEEVLAFIKELAGNSNIFEALDEYEKIKNEAKENDKDCEKALKKYRNELTDFVLKKVKTDRKAIKANTELDEAIKKGIEIVAAKESILEALRTVFILPR